MNVIKMLVIVIFFIILAGGTAFWGTTLIVHPEAASQFMDTVSTKTANISTAALDKWEALSNSLESTKNEWSKTIFALQNARKMYNDLEVLQKQNQYLESGKTELEKREQKLEEEKRLLQSQLSRLEAKAQDLKLTIDDIQKEREALEQLFE